MTKTENFSRPSSKRATKNKLTTSFKSKSKTQSTLNLCSLPNEILEQIFDNVNIWHWSHIRSTCTRLRDVCDSKLKHDFRKTLFQFSSLDSNGENYAMVKLIEDMTYVYVNAGFESTFLGTLLKLLQTNYRTPYIMLIKNIRIFLRNFYCLADEQLKTISEQHSNLLFTLTLFSILKKCKNCDVISSINQNSSNWSLTLELKGSWFGVLYSTGQFQATKNDFTLDRHEILIIFAEILFANHIQKNYKKVWEGTNKVVLCGHEPTRKTNVPKTTYEMNINGTPNLIQCISNFYHNHEIDFNSLPTDEFDIDGKIHCKEATKWGCCTTYYFYVGSDHDEETKSLPETNKGNSSVQVQSL